ncbi:MAG: S-layer homology domain-containing protein [Clostridia bacterium]|nr:S-layer homology domain-containing protein [Clostridia bacterium]
MKKLLALLLTFVFTLSCVPVFAAEQVSSTDSKSGEIAIETYELTGEWKSSTHTGLKHQWTATTGNTATFKIEGIKAGNYEVDYWLIAHKNDGVTANFAVNHNGKTDGASVIIKQNGEPMESGWVNLGVYDFAVEGDQNVTLMCQKGNVRATKIRLVPTDKPVTESKPVAEPKKEEVKEEVKEEPKTAAPDGASLTEQITVTPSGECTIEGGWKFSQAVPGPMTKAPASLWIAAGETEASVTYKPQLNTVGDVRISVYMLYWHVNQVSDVKYEVHHNGKVDEIHLNPASYTENQWVTLGSFDFAGKPEEEFVKLVTMPTADVKGNTRASTIMFEVLNSETGGLWQTVYVTPLEDAYTKLVAMVPLDKFDDMVGHWANYDVEYMANEGLVSGVAGGVFDPEAQITRAEYITILDRAMGYEAVAGESYADVAQDAWYAPYVATAKAKGLLNGLPTEDGFKPEQPITRQEMALFTYNAIKQIGKNDEWLSDLPNGWENFTDTDSVSDWATDALKYLIQTGIIKGTSDTTVSALDNATRAQGAVILKRFMQMFVWAGPPTDEEWVLTFNDEFNGTEMDWSIWKSAAQSPASLLSSRWPENAVVKDGNLNLEVRREQRGGKEWTAGSVWVRPEVFSQSYGYWEARYKIAECSGINNSFWMTTGSTKLPNTGYRYELDVNEGHYPNIMNTNYHRYYEDGTKKTYSEKESSVYDLSVDFHTYALEWNEDKLIYYLDGKVVAEKVNENASWPTYPMLSSAVLNWAGSIPDSIDKTAQVVDYVRIWQRPDKVNDPNYTVFGTPVEVEDETEEKEENVVPAVTVAEQPVDNTTYEGEIIIPGVTEGEWKTSTSFKNYDGTKEHLWTNVAGLKSTYPLAEVPKGKYKIYMWRMPHKNNIGQMDMILTQDGKDALAGSMALKIKDGESAEFGWILLGEHELTGDKNASVNYTCTGQNCRNTAIKLVPVK